MNVPIQKPSTWYALVRDGAIIATNPTAIYMSHAARDGDEIVEIVEAAIDPRVVPTGESPVDVFDPLRHTVQRSYPTRPLSEDEIASRARSRRGGEYPGFGDQLDDMWRAIAALAKGDPLPIEAQTRLAEIAAIKARNPK